MYEHILQIIDLELYRLERAREILFDGDTEDDLPALAMTLAEEPAAPEPAVTATVLPPRVRRQRTSRPRRAHAQEHAALGAAAPNGPVYVSASAVKAQQTAARPVKEAAPEPARGGEGTLDSLIRDLTRPNGSQPFAS